MTVDPIQARVGTTLRGKWKLERVLGEGGMAAVYLAVHDIGRREAIKILHRDIAAHPEVRARFEQEAYAVNRLRHPGVVAVHDIDETEDGAPFLVMELLEGETLAARRARDERIAEPEVLRIADELLDVLAAVHGIGIVHRDIKPDNLFLLPDGRLKVLDFGVARLRDGSSRVQTRAGAMLGTPNYMAPEQIRAVDVDQRVDLFAVGAVMFELVTGRDVHESSSDQELLAKMLTEPAPPLASAAPEARPELCKVVDRALAFDREQRYPDARSMQQEVRALRESAAHPVTRADASAPPAEPAQNAPAQPAVAPAAQPAPSARAGDARRDRIAVIAAAVALVVILVLLWLSSSSDSTTTEGGAAEPTRDRVQEPPIIADEEKRPPGKGQRGKKKWKHDD